MKIEQPKFLLGRTMITPGAKDTLHPEDVLRCLRRHASGDWGECVPDDWAENDFALDKYLRIFSVYSDSAGHQILDHHRSRPLGNNDPLAKRILKPRFTFPSLLRPRKAERCAYAAAGRSSRFPAVLQEPFGD